MTDRPKILSRRIWWGYGFFADDGHPDGRQRPGRLRGVGPAQPHGPVRRRSTPGTPGKRSSRTTRKSSTQHPEYLALVKGERKGPQLCVCNPAVRKLAVEYALGGSAKNPDARHGLDGDLRRQRPLRVRALPEARQHLGPGLRPGQRRGQDVAQKSPGQDGRHAGLQRALRAAVASPLEPNVYVQSTAGFIRGRYTHDELIDLWPKDCRNLGFYEYFSVWLWDFDMPPRRATAANVTRIAEHDPAVRRRSGRRASTARAATTGDCTAAGTTSPTG